MDTQIVQHATAPPSVCIYCQTHAHPEGFLVRSTLEIPVYGRVYECAGCAKDSGRAVGMVDGAELRDALEANADQARQIADLAAQLEIERAPGAKVVSVEHIPAIVGELAKVIDLGAERAKRKPKATSAA